MDIPYKTQPFAHQEKALLASVWEENFAYFMEMGTGKTWVAIINMVALWKAGKIRWQGKT